MDADRPISHRDDDRLGFSVVAEHLARAILDLPAKQGFVFGIEGKWGSGKSTLINLTIDALKRNGELAPEIIAFSPWLVGDRDELLRGLFNELAAAAVKIEAIDAPNAEATGLKKLFARDKHWKLKQTERWKNSIGGKLQAFGTLAGTASKLAKGASYFSVPGAAIASDALELSGDAAKRLVTRGSISQRKAELVDALALLSRFIVVFIDDLDRLEPQDTTEVLRLIRAVADFPNIIYVLSYDPTVVSQTLSKAVQVDDGAAFLEKIVQVSFRVPRPEAFDLRRWFQSEVHKLFADELTGDSSAQQDTVSRLAQAVNIQGGRYLKTGRDVVRALNAIHLHAIPVRKLIDIPDAVWLQLVRIGNPIFYNWIEEYLVDVAVISGGAHVSGREASAMARRLTEILEGEDLDVIHAVIELQEILPGLELPSATGASIQVYRNLTTANIEEFVASRRLGSPDHYRYYYAFSQPSGALPNETVQAFIDIATRSPDEAILMFTSLGDVDRPQGGTAAEVLIDRLEVLSERIPTAAIPGILATFADTMDLAKFSMVHADFGRHPAWEEAQRTSIRLMKRLTGETRAACIRRLFDEGKSLGWLTHLFRRETFAHGYYGDRPLPEDRRLLNSTEFTSVRNTMLRRYSEMPPAGLIRVPDLLSLLFAWKQGGGENEVREWVAANTATDSGLLLFMSLVRGWVASSVRGIHYPLKRRDLEHFLDFNAAIERLEKIASSNTAADADRILAAELLKAAKDGSED